MNAKTLLILHGWGQSAQTWQPFVQQIPDSINTVSPDLPGFGNEPLVSREWGIPEYAEWVSRFVEDQNLSDVVLLGHSFGGRIAGLLASRRPPWLKGLILSGAPCLYRPSVKITTQVKVAKIFRSFGVQKYTSRIRKGNSDLEEADANGLGQIFRNAVSFDQTETLPLISVPTLLIWGENDQEVPLSIGKEMKDLIPRSELTVISQGGHNTFLEQSLLFYGTVKRFIENN